MARKFERKTINQAIAVNDVINGGALGELVNITIEGLMLITDKEIATGSIFQLSMALPEAIEGLTTLDLGADCLWCRKAENFHRYWAGFQIIDASDLALQQIDALITQYSN